MKTAGIIAEYNPFHNGHQFHIEETRRRTGADYIIAVMSGDFVQRGAPAVLSKYVRAEMALRHGADLVLELPVTAALSNAEGFAAGGISVLDHLGVVNYLSCGCENADTNPDLFRAVVTLLSEEPEDYRAMISSGLKQGLSFPKARETAAIRYLHTRQKNPENRTLTEKEAAGFSFTHDASSDTSTKNMLPVIRQLLSEPNNILALEYAGALHKKNSSMKLCLIPRQGASYHNTELTDKYCSATAIRKYLLTNDTVTIGRQFQGHTGKDEMPNPSAVSPHATKKTSDLSRILRCFTPTDVADRLSEAVSHHLCLCEDDFSDLLFYALTVNRTLLSDFGSANSDLADRTANHLEQFESWTDFTSLLKSKNQTYTAISRYLAQILSGITREDLSMFSSLDHAPYARILGFKKEAAPLLTAIQKHADIPVLMQLAKDSSMLDEKRMRLLNLTLRSSEIYKRTLFSHSGCRMKSDYRQPMIII